MLSELSLHNFRNFDCGEVEFSDGVNALIGRNGQGKTNILEAVYYLALLRSFRTTQVNDLKQWKSNGFRLHGVCRQNDLPQTELDVMYGSERKLAVNGNPVYRTSQFINSFICVTFIPQDMELIRGGEVLRRRFLDITLSQLSPAYMKSLQNYNEALQSRNELLKSRQAFPDTVIKAYDHVLVENGIAVEIQRRELIGKINAVLERKSSPLLEDQRKLSVKYLSGIGTLLQANDADEENLTRQFNDALTKSFERDCRDGFTHSGPHRSGISCLLDNASLLHFGSEGECRIASLALKFACLEILHQKYNTQDITLLVDDVIGELDTQRQQSFFSLLMQTGQIILAGTFLPECLESVADVKHVVGGKIT